jgi:hypothetical protein
MKSSCPEQNGHGDFIFSASHSFSSVARFAFRAPVCALSRIDINGAAEFDRAPS